jgi:hypothetical protein
MSATATTATGCQTRWQLFVASRPAFYAIPAILPAPLPVEKSYASPVSGTNAALPDVSSGERVVQGMARVMRASLIEPRANTY